MVRSGEITIGPQNIGNWTTIAVNGGDRVNIPGFYYVKEGFAEGGVMVNQREFSRGRVDGIGDDGVVAAVGAVEELATGVDLDLGGAGAFRDGFAGR